MAAIIAQYALAGEAPKGLAVRTRSSYASSAFEEVR
jgi:hypothetical protein